MGRLMKINDMELERWTHNQGLVNAVDLILTCVFSSKSKN